MAVVALHNGREAQEAIFVELKSHAQDDYIPCNRPAENHTCLFVTVVAHTLNRELQMSTQAPVRETMEERANGGSAANVPMKVTTTTAAAPCQRGFSQTLEDSMRS
jgi:hypothetical protein